MSESEAPFCIPRPAPDFSGLEQVFIEPPPRMADYREAMARADAEAAHRAGEFMLVAWYDADRDFESPQHASECHLDSPIPGYVDYALSHQANLRIEFEGGRFVFFYLLL